MVRGNMMRMAWVAASVATAMAGCTCEPTPASCTDTEISWEAPASDTVSSPFDVSFSLKVAGEPFTFEKAQITIDGKTIDGSVSGARATFTGVTATAGSQQLVATIAKGTCSKTFPTKTLTVQGETCTAASVSAVTFPQDSSGDGVLNGTELPQGTMLQVRVAASCTTGVQVRIKRGTEIVGTLTDFTAGVATVTTSLPDSDNTRYDLFAELVKDGAAVNTIAGNPEASASIEVNRAPPSVSLTVAPVFGPMDDADTTAAGFQAAVTGKAPAGTSCTFAIVGKPTQTATPTMSGDVSAVFTLTSGTYSVTLTCTDGAGNSASATATFRVDFEPPTVTITAPANVDGGATMVVTQSPLTVTIATDAEDNSNFSVTRDGVQVVVGTVMGGVATAMVPFGADGDYTLIISVTDTAGNTTSKTLVVTVALSGCGVTFTRPMASGALLTPSQLQVGNNYTFQTTSKAICASQPISLHRRTFLDDGGVTAETQLEATVVGAGGVTNYTPIVVTSGDYEYRAVVVNLADGGTNEATTRVTVDLDGPAITNPVAGGMGVAVVNAAQDTQPSVAGVQRTLAFNARVPMGGRVDACIDIAVVDGMTLSPTTECGTGWYRLRAGVSSPETAFTFPNGSYHLKIVVAGGGLATAPSSQPLQILSDAIRPEVAGLTRALPQDANADGRLNIAELNGTQPQLQFGLLLGDTPTTMATTGAVVVRDVVGGAPGAVRPSTATWANGTYTVSLTGSFTELDYDLFIELTDLAGNKSLFQTSATFAGRIDLVAPSCAITAPTAALLGTAQVPGGSLTVNVATSADVGSNGVNLTMTGFSARLLTPALNQAQSIYALTGDTTNTIGATCTDQSGNAATAPSQVTRVDLVAPTCNILAPTNNFVSGANDVSTAVAVTGVNDGDTVTMSSSVAGITNNLLTVSGGTATRVVRYPNGAQTVTASISDSAGNACVAPTGGRTRVQLTVNSTSCNLDFAGGTVITNTNGSWINRASAGNSAGTSPFTVTVGGSTSDCGGGKNVFLYQGAPSATPSGTPQVSAANGSVTFSGVSVSEGQQWTMTIDNGAGILTHRSFIVSFAMPSIGSISLQRSLAATGAISVAANAPLVYGAATANRRVETATASDLVFGDLDAVAAGAQFQLTLAGIDGARVGTLNATLDVLEGATPLMPSVSVTSAGFNPTLPRMTLGHRADETTTNLVIRVTSPADNVFVSTHASEVDVIAPAVPSYSPTLSSARGALIGLSWMPVYDDGSTAGSGGLTGGVPTLLAGYDIRWTTSSITAGNQMATDTDYFSTAAHQEPLRAWQGTAIAMSVAVPPINTYYLTVRARDEVGNYSTFSAPAPIVNDGTNNFVELQLTDGVAGSAFGTSVDGTRDLSGDGVNDVVVAAPTTSSTGVGAVYVYRGGATLTSQSMCGTGCQQLLPPDGQAGQFGADISVGNVGEAGNDLVVAQPRWNANQGRVFIFFGGSGNLDTVQYIEIRGNTQNTFFGSSARVIRSIDGDSLDELAISTPTWDATNANTALRSLGRVYIFKGRTRAAWQALGAQVPLTAADWIIEGPNPRYGTGSAYGQNRNGLVPLGDLDGDGRGEFSVPISRELASRFQLWRGSTVNGATIPLLSSQALQELSDTAGTGTGLLGFGAAAIGGLDVTGDGGVDLVVSNPRLDRIYVHSALTSSGTSGVPVTLAGVNRAGATLAGCDFSGDGFIDVLAGEGGSAPTTVWGLFSVGGTLPGFGTATDHFATAIRGGGPTSFVGASVSCAEVTGDSSPDFVLGDSALGLVRIVK